MFALSLLVVVLFIVMGNVCPVTIMQDLYLACIANERATLHRSLSVSTCLILKHISHLSLIPARQALAGMLLFSAPLRYDRKILSSAFVSSMLSTLR